MADQSAQLKVCHPVAISFRTGLQESNKVERGALDSYSISNSQIPPQSIIYYSHERSKSRTCTVTTLSGGSLATRTPRTTLWMTSESNGLKPRTASYVCHSFIPRSFTTWTSILLLPPAGYYSKENCRSKKLHS